MNACKAACHRVTYLYPVLGCTIDFVGCNGMKTGVCSHANWPDEQVDVGHKGNDHMKSLKQMAG
jgi:hypothetical protein